MAKKNIEPDELVTSHIPKNFKYYYHIKDEELKNQLIEKQFDLSKLDTINNPSLIELALNTKYDIYERTIVGKAKEPTIMDNGVVISKKMVTKADKKLQQFGIGFFKEDHVQYVSIRMYYEKFDIIEIFILT